MLDKKHLRITFSNGSVYDLPVEDLLRYYAKLVLMQIDNVPLEAAMNRARKHFEEDPGELIHFASFGLSWLDVVLHAEEITRAIGGNKEHEWATAAKELIEPAKS